MLPEKMYSQRKNWIVSWKRGILAHTKIALENSLNMFLLEQKYLKIIFSEKLKKTDKEFETFTQKEKKAFLWAF